MAAQPAASPEQPPQLASAVRPGSGGGAMAAVVQTPTGSPAPAAPKRARARAKPAARSAGATAAGGGAEGAGDGGSAVLAPGRTPVPVVDEQGNPLSKEQIRALKLRARMDRKADSARQARRHPPSHARTRPHARTRARTRHKLAPLHRGTAARCSAAPRRHGCARSTISRA